MNAELQDPCDEKRTEILTKLAAILAPSISRIMPHQASGNNNYQPDQNTIKIIKKE